VVNGALSTPNARKSPTEAGQREPVRSPEATRSRRFLRAYSFLQSALKSRNRGAAMIVELAEVTKEKKESTRKARAGRGTVAQLAEQFDVHPNQVTRSSTCYRVERDRWLTRRGMCRLRRECRVSACSCPRARDNGCGTRLHERRTISRAQVGDRIGPSRPRRPASVPPCPWAADAH
jgi:hypothetical protein